MEKLTLDAGGVYYRQLNERIREAVAGGHTDFELINVRGQRYIADALDGDLRFHIRGVPGQDLGAFMRGPKILVTGNAQDGVGNTMDDGEIVVDGLAGDVLGYAMRGGRIMVRGDVGYRVGIHMKAYKEKVPVVVIGGKAGDFLGEYMAGGAIVLLGMFSGNASAPIAGRSLGTGMHGGVIYVRGGVPAEQLGPHLKTEAAGDEDRALLSKHVTAFAEAFGLDAKAILDAPFVRVKPFSHRPYGNLYVAA
ncbi:MAG: hypothetical protein HQK81_01925 [Desulfovibrionaceae bacterium]|nr:hypothetical protein [Desulfovibrionaceae bacterium]MBF0512802.1 hypothetical protein [Desulfovibrionaceae bacterium]